MNKTTPTLSLLDLPSEILEKIILQVSDEKDIYLHPFININLCIPAGSNVCVVPYKCQRERTDRPGRYTQFNHKWNRFREQHPHCNVLPGTLCILSRVSKGMHDEINNNKTYWRNMYIRDCRKGRPLKYDNSNYKLKYLQKIHEYYSVILKKSKYELEYTTNKLSAKVNNAEIYRQIMREAVLNDAIDLPNQIYHIPDLKQAIRNITMRFRRDIVFMYYLNEFRSMYRDIKFEEILNSRRTCLEEIVLYKKNIHEETPKIQKIEDIIEGLKIQGCKTLY